MQRNEEGVRICDRCVGRETKQTNKPHSVPKDSVKIHHFENKIKDKLFSVL